MSVTNASTVFVCLILPQRFMTMTRDGTASLFVIFPLSHISSNCVSCLRCGTRDPGTSGWAQSYTLCSPCSTIYKEKVATQKKLLLEKLAKLKAKRQAKKRKRSLEMEEKQRRAQSPKKVRTEIPAELSSLGPFGPSLLPVPWEKVRLKANPNLLSGGGTKSICLPAVRRNEECSKQKDRFKGRCVFNLVPRKQSNESC